MGNGCSKTNQITPLEKKKENHEIETQMTTTTITTTTNNNNNSKIGSRKRISGFKFSLKSIATTTTSSKNSLEQAIDTPLERIKLEKTCDEINKEYIPKLGSYLPQQFLMQIKRFQELEKPKPFAIKVEGALLFIDITGFTKLTTTLKSAEKMTKHINKYFKKVIDIVHLNGGDIEKFVGDGIVVMFYDDIKRPYKKAKDEEKSRTIQRALECAMSISTLEHCIQNESELPKYEHTVVASEKIKTTMQHYIEETRKEMGSLAVANLSLSFKDKNKQIKETTRGDEEEEEEKLTNLEITTHCAVGYGHFHIQHLGGVNQEWKRIIISEVFEEIAPAVAHSTARQVAITRKAYKYVEDKVDATKIPVCDDYLIHDVYQQGERETRIQPVVLNTAQKGWMRLYVAPQLLPQISQGANINNVKRVTVAFVSLTLDKEGKDFEKLHHLLVDTQEALEKNEATLGNFVMDEKSIMMALVFGHPVQHENDAERAVRTCFQLNMTYEDIHSIGIATGKVFIGAVGSIERQDFTMMGAHINMAARLMSLKGLSSIIICKDTRQELGESIHVKSLGRTYLKGIKEATEVFEVTGVQKDTTTIQVEIEKETILYGRDKELGILLENMKTFNERMMLVHGDSGSGKTSILRTLYQFIQTKLDNSVDVHFLTIQEKIERSPLMLFDFCMHSVFSSFQDEGIEQAILQRCPVPLKPYLYLLNEYYQVLFNGSFTLKPTEQPYVLGLVITWILSLLSKKQHLVFLLDNLERTHPITKAVLQVIINPYDFEDNTLKKVQVDIQQQFMIIATMDSQHLVAKSKNNLVPNTSITEDLLSKGIDDFINEIPLKTHYYHLIPYPKTFRGVEAVAYLMSYFQCKSEEEAIVIGNIMIRRGVFHHATGDHLLKNQPFFYRLHRDSNRLMPFTLTPIKFLKQIDHQQLALPRLCKIKTHEFIQKAYRLERIPPTLTDFIYQKSLGIPQIILFCIDAMLASKTIKLHKKTRDITILNTLGDLQLPPTIGHDIRQRVDQLDTAANQVLTVASCILEDCFDETILSTLLPDIDDLFFYLEVLIQGRFLKEVKNKYAFYLPIYQDIISTYTTAQTRRHINGELAQLSLNQGTSLAKVIHYFSHSNCLFMSTSYSKVAVDTYLKYLRETNLQPHESLTLYNQLKKILLHMDEEQTKDHLVNVCFNICDMHHVLAIPMDDHEHRTNALFAFGNVKEKHQDSMAIFFEAFLVYYEENNKEGQELAIEKAKLVCESTKDYILFYIMEAYHALQCGFIDQLLCSTQNALDLFEKSPKLYHSLAVATYQRFNSIVLMYFLNCLGLWLSSQKVVLERQIDKWAEAVTHYHHHLPTMCIHQSLYLNLNFLMHSDVLFNPSYFSIKSYRKLLKIASGGDLILKMGNRLPSSNSTATPTEDSPKVVSPSIKAPTLRLPQQLKTMTPNSPSLAQPLECLSLEKRMIFLDKFDCCSDVHASPYLRESSLYNLNPILLHIFKKYFECMERMEIVMETHNQEMILETLESFRLLELTVQRILNELGGCERTMLLLSSSLMIILLTIYWMTDWIHSLSIDKGSIHVAKLEQLAARVFVAHYDNNTHLAVFDPQFLMLRALTKAQLNVAATFHMLDVSRQLAVDQNSPSLVHRNDAAKAFVAEELKNKHLMN